MRLGGEYITSNKYTAFPFKEDSTGVVYEGLGTHGSGATVPADFLVDAQLLAWSSDTVFLSSIEKTSGTSVTLNFSDDTPTEIYSVAITIPTISGDAFSIVPLYSITPPDDQFEVVIYGRLVATEAFTTYLTAMPIGTNTYDLTLPFSPHAVDQRSSKVLSLEARNTMPVTPGRGLDALDGAITLRSGYNMDLEAEANDAETDVQEITLAAIPGAGLGVVPCDDTSIVFEDPAPPQQLHPDTDGNVRIVGDDCYDVLPDRTAGTIQLQGSCYACCDCDDFTAIGDDLSGLLDRTKVLYTDLSETHEGPLEEVTVTDPEELEEAGYEQAVTYWNTAASSRRVYPEYIHFQVHGAAGYDGALNRGSITFSVKNALSVDQIWVRFWIVHDNLKPNPKGSFATYICGYSHWQDGEADIPMKWILPKIWSNPGTTEILLNPIPSNTTRRTMFELKAGAGSAINGTMLIYMQYSVVAPGHAEHVWYRGGDTASVPYHPDEPPDHGTWDDGRAKYEYPLIGKMVNIG